MKFTVTSLAYRFRDESGVYEFEVLTSQDEGCGWRGAVSFASFGNESSDAAVRSLRAGCMRFLKMIDEEFPE
jgi:hypothetical protein